MDDEQPDIEEPTLGFAGRVLGGGSPDKAWAAIAADIQGDPEVQQFLRRLAATPEGRAMMREQRTTWNAQGYPPPWEVGLGAIDMEGHDNG